MTNMSTPPPFAFGTGAFGVNPFGGSPALNPTPLPNPSVGPNYNPSNINHLTWLLDVTTNDLCLDASGNIAIAAAPYAIAQDVATQLSTFLGECWYDATQGVPYWQQILGQRPPASLLVSLLQAQALKVPDVVSATAILGTVGIQRGVTGQMTITDIDGNTFTTAIGGTRTSLLATQSGSPITIGGDYIEV